MTLPEVHETYRFLCSGDIKPAAFKMKPTRNSYRLEAVELVNIKDDALSPPPANPKEIRRVNLDSISWKDRLPIF